jgi:16S rRNA U516 pseudouridylate synthase RsuA-like enzyme
MAAPVEEGEKIHKVLAAAGVASRRAAEGLVLAGENIKKKKE